MIKQHFITKQDFKRFLICFKLTWLNKTSSHWIETQKLITKKKVVLSSKLKKDLPSDPVSIDALVPKSTANIVDFKGVYHDGGNRIGELARLLYKTQFDKTYDLTIYSLAPALNLTTQLVQQSNYQVLFEAAFQFGNFRTRVDILLRDEQTGGWKLIEVKAKSDRVFLKRGGKSKKLELLADLRYQFFILTKCQVEITEVSLLLIRHDYMLFEPEVDPEQLFIKVDSFHFKQQPPVKFIDDCLQNLEITEQQLNALNEAFIQTKNWSGSQILLADNCFNQGKDWRRYFEHCPHVLPYVSKTGSVFNLWRPNTRSIVLFYEYGIRLLQDIPLNFKFNHKFKIHHFTEFQNRQIAIAHCAEGVIWKNKIALIKRAWGEYRLPLYFYDFESFQTPIPIYCFTTPYQQLVFQYSVHVLTKFDDSERDVVHFEYISDSARDCRLSFIEKLVKDFFTFGTGVYVAYNKSFECGRLKELIHYLKLLINNANIDGDRKFLYKHYINKIKLIVSNTIDLMIFFSRFLVYLPAFNGSYSIKVTLPALAPQFTYRHLAVQKGDQASELFYRLVIGNFTNKVWQQHLAPSLLQYCAQDSKAMVIIWKKLQTLFRQHQIID